LSPGKILIVDDEPDTVIGMQALFEDAGYETIGAYDGGEGYEKAKSEKPDLITLDCAMEKVSGIKAYKLLNQDAETRDIPVILITGVSRELKRFLNSRKSITPPAGYFEKPVDRDALLNKVSEILGETF
jgi:two-component system alkaline phosphatase synthesis response regulator PhoP